MTLIEIIGLAIVALIVYGIASHKITAAAIHSRIEGLSQQIHGVHAAALAPVSVVNAPQPVAPSDPAAIVANALGAPPPAAPNGSPVANNAGNAALAGYADSGDVRGANAGGNVDAAAADAAAAARRDEEENSPAFDYSRPNSGRIFRAGGPGRVARSITIPPDAACSAVILHTGDTVGNAVDYVDVTVVDSNGAVAIAGRFPVRYQNHRFAVQPGHTYVISASTEDPALAVGGSCALAMSVRFEPIA